MGFHGLSYGYIAGALAERVPLPRRDRQSGREGSLTLQTTLLGPLTVPGGARAAELEELSAAPRSKRNGPSPVPRAASRRTARARG